MIGESPSKAAGACCALLRRPRRAEHRPNRPRDRRPTTWTRRHGSRRSHACLTGGRPLCAPPPLPSQCRPNGPIMISAAGRREASERLRALSRLWPGTIVPRLGGAISRTGPASRSSEHGPQNRRVGPLRLACDCAGPCQYRVFGVAAFPCAGIPRPGDSDSDPAPPRASVGLLRVLSGRGSGSGVAYLLGAPCPGPCGG